MGGRGEGAQGRAKGELFVRLVYVVLYGLGGGSGVGGKVGE